MLATHEYICFILQLAEILCSNIIIAADIERLIAVNRDDYNMQLSR